MREEPTPRERGTAISPEQKRHSDAPSKRADAGRTDTWPQRNRHLTPSDASPGNVVGEILRTGYLASVAGERYSVRPADHVGMKLQAEETSVRFRIGSWNVAGGASGLRTST